MTTAVVPEPRTCRVYEFPSQLVCGATTAAKPALTVGDAPSSTRLSSPKKRSRQYELRQQHALPMAPSLWRRPDNDGSDGGAGGGGGGGGSRGRAEWRLLCNKENIDPRTGRHVQHPFSPFSPFSTSLLAGGPAITAATPALSAAAGTSGRTSSIQKRLFCGSGCGEGGQALFRPAAAISRKPFGEPLRGLRNSCSGRCM